MYIQTNTAPSLTDTSRNNRIPWIDWFRAVMIFAIAWGHALCAEPTTFSAVNRYLYSFHVPAFFFISGYTFHSGTGFRQYAVKKTRTLMIPYFVFSSVSILIFLFLGSVASAGLGVAVTSTELLPNILGMLYASGATGYMKWNLPLWFLPCMFASSLLFYWLRKVIDAAGKHEKENLAFAGLLGAALLVSFLNYRYFHITKLPFGLETAVYMLPFFIAGSWMKAQSKPESADKFKLCFLGGLLLCAGAAVALSNPGRVDYVSSWYSNLVLFYLSAFLSVFGYILLCRQLPLCRLGYVGRNSLAILVMHKFPIVFMQLFLIGYMGKNPFLGIAIALAMAVIACALSLLAGEIIGRLMPFALGRQRKKAQ